MPLLGVWPDWERKCKMIFEKKTKKTTTTTTKNSIQKLSFPSAGVRPMALMFSLLSPLPTSQSDAVRTVERATDVVHTCLRRATSERTDRDFKQLC